MKKYALLLIFGLTLGFTSCKEEKKEGEDAMTEEITPEDTVGELPNDEKIVSIVLEPKSDSRASGTVVFKELNGKVTMTALINGLQPGMHAIHIHENADCSAADGTSAGGHWNPTKQQHGRWGDAEGYHRGDIGNFLTSENGVGTVTHTTEEWCIGCEDETKNILGKSVIVHAGVDDYVSQPSGNAGARVACAGIIED